MLGVLPYVQVSIQSIIHVSIANFNDFVEEVNRNHTTAKTHAVFDLGGHEMHCGPGALNIYLTANHITIRNGTILLGSGFGSTNSLIVDGCDVHLDKVVIKGGHIGLRVSPGGHLTMRTCEVHNARYGLVVGSIYKKSARAIANARLATLVAADVKVIGYHCIGLSVQPASKVELSACCISGGNDASSDCLFSAAVKAAGPRTVVVARRLVSSDYVGTAIHCSDKAKIVLQRCTVMESLRGASALKVHGIGSTVNLLYSKLSEPPKESSGAVCSFSKLVSSRRQNAYIYAKYNYKNQHYGVQAIQA